LPNIVSLCAQPLLHTVHWLGIYKVIKSKVSRYFSSLEPILYTFFNWSVLCRKLIYSWLIYMTIVQKYVTSWYLRDIQWLCGPKEVVGGSKNLYFCPHSGLKMST
jgi:hypothetical protein